MTEYKPLKYKRWELAFLILPIASLIISCILVSSKKNFWSDELFSYYFISDSSFSHMLTAFHDKINNTPILYFFLSWFWDKIFGSSELSYRLFSSITFCIALVSVWITLRRHYNFWPTTIGTLGVFCTSYVILYQNSEARMYGLFLAVSALAFCLYDKFYNNEKPSYKSLVLNAGIHVAIIHSHLFGPFYSGGILLSLILSDRYLKLWRPKIYLSIILSWLTFILYIPSFLIQADAGNPRTWLPLPNLSDLLSFYNLSVFVSPIIFGFLIFICALHFIFKQRFTDESKLLRQENVSPNRSVPIILFACIFFMLPAFVWVYSCAIKPIFWYRYMIPSALGVIILLTEVSSRLITMPIIGDTFKKNNLIKIIRFLMVPGGLIILTLYFLWLPVSVAQNFRSGPKSSWAFEEFKEYPDLPIVMQSSDQFLIRNFYSPLRNKYFFILDWEAAVNKSSGLWGPQQFKHFTALRKVYPDRFKNNILTTGEFLARYDRFLVTSYCADTMKCPEKPRGLQTARQWFGSIDCPQWVAMRLLNNASYKITHLDPINYVSYSLVEKKSNRN